MIRLIMLTSILLAFILAAVPAPAQAQGGVSRLGDDMDLGWHSYRDLTSERFAELFQELRGRGLMMVDTEAYPQGNATRYATVWTTNVDGRGWAAYRDMTSQGYGERWQEFLDRGWRPADIEIYSTRNGLRYAGIWVENRERVRWASRRDLTGQQYGDWFSEQRDAGMRLIDMEAYQTSEGLRYAAIWVHNTDNREWAQLRNMTRESYQQELEQRSAQGFRVVDFEAWNTANGTRYGAIWERRPGSRAMQVRTDRTAQQFGDLWTQYRDEGYRLHDFERYDTPNGPRYGGIWVENDNRFRHPRKGQIDTAVQNYRSTNALPGISVAVIHRGNFIYRRGFGMADIGNSRPAHSETVYNIASIAKPVGGVLATRIANRPVRRGGTPALDLSRTTRSYLTAMPEHHNHTVAQLLAHLGCVRHYPNAINNIPGIPGQITHYATQLAASQSIWDNALVANCTTGTDRNYSTHSFTFVGAVLEGATGQSLPQLLGSEITTPHNLDSLRVQYATENLPANANRAVPYRDDGTAGSYSNSSWKILGGGMESNVVDLARFGEAVRAARLVTADVRDNQLWSPVRANCGNSIAAACSGALGWALNTVDSRRVAEHGGEAMGARNHLQVYRDDELVIAVLTNRRTTATLTSRTTHNPAILTRQIANIVLAP
jgi:CubicO group peptidase (beta-lactamase class C family)